MAHKAPSPHHTVGCRDVCFSPYPWLPSQLIYLPPPWGDCKATTGDSEFYDTYSITACRIDCETRYLVENCNCRMVHMPGELCIAVSRPKPSGNSPMGNCSVSCRRCPLLHPRAVQGVRRSGLR